jgi:hypothetical protein
LFWVRMLELNILMSLSSNPLDMSMLQRNFVCHYYSRGEDSGIVGSGGRHTHSKGNVREEEAEEDNDRFSSSGSGKRKGKGNKNEFREDNDNNDDRNWTVLGLFW